MFDPKNAYHQFAHRLFSHLPIQVPSSRVHSTKAIYNVMTALMFTSIEMDKKAELHHRDYQCVATTDGWTTICCITKLSTKETKSVIIGGRFKEMQIKSNQLVMIVRNPTSLRDLRTLVFRSKEF